MSRKTVRFFPGAYLPGSLRSITSELPEVALTCAEVDAVADLNGVHLKMEQAS